MEGSFARGRFLSRDLGDGLREVGRFLGNAGSEGRGRLVEPQCIGSLLRRSYLLRLDSEDYLEVKFLRVCGGLGDLQGRIRMGGTG